MSKPPINMEPVFPGDPPGDLAVQGNRAVRVVQIRVDNSYVLGAAISRAGLVCYLPRPARHGDVIGMMAGLGMKTPIGHCPSDVQGFMTRDGFRTRAETKALLGMRGDARLYSEDLW